MIHSAGEEEEEEEDLFVFNDTTIEGPRAPAVNRGSKA